MRPRNMWKLQPFLKQTTDIFGIPRWKACSLNCFLTGTCAHKCETPWYKILTPPVATWFYTSTSTKFVFRGEGSVVMQNDGLVTASNEGDSRRRQPPLHSNDLIRCDLEILSFFSRRVGPVSLLYSNWTHIIWITRICRQSGSWPVIWKNKSDLSESLDQSNRQGNLDGSSSAW